MTVALEVGNQIRAVSAVVTRLRFAFVDLVIAQLSIVSVQALAGVESNVIDAGRVVFAFSLKAFVNVLGTVVFLIANWTVASVVFRWVSTEATIFTILFEA